MALLYLLIGGKPMNLIKKVIVKIMLYICIIIVGFIILFGSGFSAYASEEYKTVLEELKSDPKFNEEDYPDKIDDYNLYVMQIAETRNKELILYAYQPSHIKYDLQATKISLSYGFSKDGKNLTPRLYPLKLLDTEGVFDKYLVSNYEVPNDNYRYYNLISIYRTFNNKIDGDINDIYHDWSDKAISVGQQWCAYNINDSVAYEVGTFNTMQINTTLNFPILFENGLKWGNFIGKFDWGDCWIICFNAPSYAIKHIYDADVSYTKQSIKKTWALGPGTSYEKGNIETETISLKDEDTMTYKGDGLFARKYQWNRILSNTEFISNIENDNNKINLNADAKKIILESEWVFTYAITERTGQYFEFSNYETYTEISDVGILRLHFMDTTGMIYDLGVVNSLTSPNGLYGGYGTTKILDTITGFFQKLFAILGFVVLILIFMFFSNLLTPFIMILKEIWKTIKYVLSLPFKLIKWIFKK